MPKQLSGARCHTRLLLHSFCYASCGMAIYATFFSLISFLLFYLGYSLYLYPSFLHLKHLTTQSCSSISCLLSSTPYLITLLLNISNLFWGMTFSFSSSPLFLQFWARCLYFLQHQQIFPFLSSTSTLI